MKNALQDALLYGIIDTGYLDVTEMQSAAKSLLKGGVGILQLRAKGFSESQILALLADHLPNLMPLCRQYKVPLIINDFPHVAVEIGADGVHIGQDDGSLAEARKIVGASMIVGRSTHSPAQAREALAEGFDYIGFGPLFPTPTKKGRPGIGLENVAIIQKDVGTHIPMFCIGGIKPDNLEVVKAAGAQRVVIVSSILQANDITKATQTIVNSL